MVLFLAAACSGPGTGVETLVREVEQRPPAVVEDYEGIDIERYPEEPPAPLPKSEHDVPAVLLSGRVQGMAVPRMRSGYRIEILSTEEKEVADRLAAEAAAWWRTMYDSGLLDEIYRHAVMPPPIYQEFRSPYYRVRVGDFLARADAESMLGVVERRFADAFIAPADVWDTRRP